MKILERVVFLMIITFPMQSAIIQQRGLAEIVKKKSDSKKSEDRELFCSSSKQTFNLIYIALMIYLIFSDCPKWAIALFTLPFLLRFIETIFVQVSTKTRKLILSKDKIPKMKKFLRKMKNMDEMDLEEEKSSVLKFLNTHNYLKKRNKALSQNDMFGMITKYFSEVKGMKGDVLNGQIKMVLRKLFANKDSILELIRDFV